MTVSSPRALARVGRPSNADLAQREAQARLVLVRLLVRMLQHLNHPSRLADSPLCQLEGVRRQAAGLHGYRYPRAHIVIEAVRRAYELAWAELGETEDAGCLIALADALAGRSREESARLAGVCPTEISRRRREAVDMIADHVLGLLNGP
jgi:hypothetical protein